MNNLLILVNRITNTNTGNPRYTLQAVDSNGFISNHILLNAGYKMNKKDQFIISTYNLDDVKTKIQALNNEFDSIILVKF